MYALASNLVGLPVISLQTGETIASVIELVIDQDRLQLAAFVVDAGRSEKSILIVGSVRQLATDCVIIDNIDELSEPDEVIRLIPLLKLHYSPLNKQVITETGRNMGTVEDYTFNLETEQIQKIYVRPSILRAWYRSSLIIDRSQIIDVQPSKIIVRDARDYAELKQDTSAAKAG